MRLTTITFLLLVLTSTKILACGKGECDPEPEKPSVERLEPEKNGATSGGVYYSVCTCDKMKVAWGFESLEVLTSKARSQCEAVRIRKSCHEKWK